MSCIKCVILMILYSYVLYKYHGCVLLGGIFLKGKKSLMVMHLLGERAEVKFWGSQVGCEDNILRFTFPNIYIISCQQKFNNSTNPEATGWT